MTRGIKSDENSCSGKIRQAPVPSLRGTCAIIPRQERFLRGAETPSPGCADWQPNDIQEEIQQHKGRGEVEDVTEVTS